MRSSFFHFQEGVGPSYPKSNAKPIGTVSIHAGSDDLCEGLKSISQQLTWIHLKYLFLRPQLVITESTATLLTVTEC